MTGSLSEGRLSGRRLTDRHPGGWVGVVGGVAEKKQDIISDRLNKL